MPEPFGTPVVGNLFKIIKGKGYIVETSDISETQVEIAARVLAQKQLSDAAAPAHADQAEDGVTPGDEGMTSTPRSDYPRSGAFDAEGQRPVLERSRKVR